MQGLLELLLEDLRSDDATVRCDALRQLAETPFDEAVRAQLELLRDDRNQPRDVLFLVNQALAAGTPRKSRARAAFPEYESVDDLDQQLLLMETSQLRQVVAACPRTAQADLLQILRDRLPFEPDSEKRAVFLDAFRRWGAAGDETILLPMLQAEEPNQVIAAISALEKIAPSRLQHYLPGLLASPYFPVKIKALRALLHLDLQAGLERLQSLFAAEQPLERCHAVMLCLTVAFQHVREMVFHALAVEEDARVLARATYLLFLNPDQQTVFWLMDIADGAAETKVQWCMATLKVVLQGIKLSGILNDEEQIFIQRVRALIEKRRRSTTIKSLFAELENSDPMRRYEAVEALRDYQTLPEVQERLAQLADSEKDARIQGLLTAIFAKHTSLQNLQIELSAVYFSTLPRDEQLELLGQIRTAEMFHFLQRELHLLLSVPLDPVTQAETVRLLGRFGSAQHEESLLLQALASPEPLVRVRAVEAIGRVAPNILKQRLPSLLAEQESTVRIATIRSLFKQDRNAALKLVWTMLTGTGAQAKNQALVCLAQLPYSAVRPLLLRFLELEENHSLLLIAGRILAENPDLDAVKALQTLIASATRERQDVLRDILQQCLQQAGSEQS